MKGPRSRHKFYIARVWECPACKKRAYTAVDVVNRACNCKRADAPAWMSLLDEEPLPARKFAEGPISPVKNAPEA
jgi:hypothetical protein